jgi:hypothetical protein
MTPMIKPATNITSKAWIEAAHKLGLKSAADICPDTSLYDAIFDAVHLLLIKEGRSREETFDIIRENCAGMPVSDQEIDGIIDLVCIGRLKAHGSPQNSLGNMAGCS